jgi:hypothetical protein
MASLAESENRGPSTKGEDSLSTLVDIMKDLDAHYSADDDMVVVQKIRETNSDIKKIIKEKEVEPRKLIRGKFSHALTSPLGLPLALRAAFAIEYTPLTQHTPL